MTSLCLILRSLLSRHDLKKCSSWVIFQKPEAMFKRRYITDSFDVYSSFSNIYVCMLGLRRILCTEKNAKMREWKEGVFVFQCEGE